MSSSAEWASGPARWGAVAILGGAGVLGVARGVFSDRTHEPIPVTQVTTATIQSAAGVLAKPNSHPDQAEEPAASTQPARIPMTQAADQSPANTPLANLSDADDISVQISVNAAAVGELQMLPRIGPVLAQRIVDDRTANGPFSDVGDLQRVRGIGPKTAEQLAPLVRFD